MSELIDRQALKDYVSSLSTHPLNEWDTWGVLAAIDKQPTVTASPWRRVEEELPKDRETVLIYCENTGGIVKSHYHEFIGSGGKKHYWFSGGTYYPKYWMPLPEPPKEDE